MMMRALSVGVLMAVTATADDQRLPMRSDVNRDVVTEARSAQPSFEMIRHYEGLKHLLRGRLLERQQRLTEAMQAYDTALQFEPTAVELMRMSIPINFKLERTVPALRLLRDALRQKPDQPDLWLRYAQELLDLQRHDELVRLVPQALQAADFKASPAFRADLFVVQAAALDALQRHEEAVTSYRQALTILEDHDRYLEDPYSPTAEELPLEQSKLLERLGRACQKAGQYEAALAAFRQANQVHPRKDGRLDLNLTEVLLTAKRPQEAWYHLQCCLKTKPPSDEPYRLLVQALRDLGKSGEIVPTLEKLLTESPGHPAVRVVLAEQYVHAGRKDEARRLFQELMAQERVSIPVVCRGYFQLLVQLGREKEALTEFQALCRQPPRASWARAATVTLLGEPKLLQRLLDHHNAVELTPSVRLLLLKMALQSRLWPAAEALARQQIAHDPKPTEAYLLLCRSLLEQQRYAELIETCRQALQSEAVTQPLVFHLEIAKALAMTRQAAPALQAIESARQLVSPGTTDSHKLLCTELYVLHLLGRHQDCIRLGLEAMTTDVARSPWARQVRYILAHAMEATAQFDAARQQLDHILREDPNDDEAAAAKARCLFLQNQDVAEAEKCIREAIELDYVAQFKRNKTNPTETKPNPAYQATLGAILLRTGRTSEGISLLAELERQAGKADPWISMCVGDGCLYQQRREQAERHWKDAQRRADQWPALGFDVRPSVQARLRSLSQSVLQTGAALPVVPASLSSPPRP